MCTTILVGKNASYDGSTLMARNEDSPSGQFSAKKLVVVLPENQPRKYKSVLSSFSIDLPDNPLRYTSMPNADSKEGIWAAAGVNSANVSMTATETLTSNYRVTAADPFVKDGISEEDMVTIVLPYIHSAKEGALYLADLLEKYGKPTAKAMVESAKRHIDILEKLNFYDYALSESKLHRRGQK